MNRVNNEAELEARELIESSREADWKGKSFMKEIFLGKFRYDWIAPFPETAPSAEFLAWAAKVKEFFETKVDPIAIDATGEYPAEMLDGLRALGAFGIKTPKEYGGLGFNQVEYGLAMELMGRYDASVLALLSAHQSIGVPTPVKLFGTEEQKKRFLPRTAKGAISAFALTEPDVGSDPGKLTTSCVKNADGNYVLNGMKLWCTNGTIAELMVVMARDPETKKISAFIVEANTPGIRVVHRCRFMGLKALANALIEFKDVVVPKENLLSKEGDGLKIALTTLNTGRLSIPSGVAGGSRDAIRACREFALDRVQWGAPVGRHEAISHKLASMAGITWAMESVTRLANELAHRPGYDIRLEASASKEWCTTRHWDLLDTAMQIRGGRGYEMESSLIARGIKPENTERAMRDARINRIFEGSSEIMHLFMAREALDKHLQVSGDFVKPKSTMGQKMGALPNMIKFYAVWYPTLFLGLFTMFKYRDAGALGTHLRFAERATRRLARTVFHGMVVHQAKLEKKQGFLFRAVEIANEIFAISASTARAQKLKQRNDPSWKEAEAVADLFARGARRRINDWFRDMWKNDDDFAYKSGIAVLEGKHAWLEGEKL
jgi:alkylation response protein AidB-like acyl-CoA dehydrogenase